MSDPHPGFEPAPDAFAVKLENFEGPLDLLLYLIKKNEVSIHDIPIALITAQYLETIAFLQELDLDVAGEFLVMAATLIHIKSKMLLPHDDDEVIEDPRQELVDRLLEYQRFKAVAESFAELDVLRMGVWPRPATPIPGTDASEIDMSEVGLFDLIDAFRSALNRYKQNHPQAIELRRTVHKISDKMRELYTKLQEKSPIRLQWFLEGRDRNAERIRLEVDAQAECRFEGLPLRLGQLRQRADDRAQELVQARKGELGF